MNKINVSRTKKSLKKLAPEISSEVRSSLNKLKEFMGDAVHEVSGLKFGGALLAPHINTAHLNNIIKPAINKFEEIGKSAINSPEGKAVLNLQHEITKKVPSLVNKIGKEAVSASKDAAQTFASPFKDMNTKALYHTVMNMGHSEWKRVQDLAGAISGKVKSVFGGGLLDPKDVKSAWRQMIGGSVSGGAIRSGGSISGGIIPSGGSVSGGAIRSGGSLGGSVSGGKMDEFDRMSHVMDIARSHSPHLAAHRLERDHLGSGFSDVLRDVLNLDHHMQMKRNMS